MRPEALRDAIASGLRNIRTATSVPQPQGDGRHTVHLELLLRDKDRRFRPSRQLVKLMRTDPKITHPGELELDRPLVPLLNALVECGFRPLASCVNKYVLIEGVTDREAQVLGGTVARRFPGSFLQWAVTKAVPEGSTGVYWPTPAEADAAAVDAALFAAAGDVRSLRLVPGVAKPEAMIAAEIRAHLLAEGSDKSSCVFVGPDIREGMSSGMRCQIGNPPNAEVRYAPTLHGLKPEFGIAANQLR